MCFVSRFFSRWKWQLWVSQESWTEIHHTKLRFVATKSQPQLSPNRIFCQKHLQTSICSWCKAAFVVGWCPLAPKSEPPHENIKNKPLASNGCISANELWGIGYWEQAKSPNSCTCSWINGSIKLLVYNQPNQVLKLLFLFGQSWSFSR